MIKTIVKTRRLIPAYLCLLVMNQLISDGAWAAGNWLKLNNPTPNNAPVQLMLLLTDGTVMAADSRVTNQWYKLTPDTNGNYVNGTWSTLAPMASTRLFFSSTVLRDGRVFVAGGEYGNGKATAEIYNPLANAWTTLNVPTNIIDSTQPSPASSSGAKQGFLDAGAMLLPDGRVLVAPVFPQRRYDTVIYDPVNDSWSAGPTNPPANQDESSWVKLPDESILTIDSGATSTERYLPVGYLTNHIPAITSNQWLSDSNAPVSVFDSIGNEIGPAMLLADGTVFFVGGTGNSAIYTPSGDDTPGSWQVGPNLPSVFTYLVDDNGYELRSAAVLTNGVAADAPAASLINGQLLYAFGGPLFNDSRAVILPADTTNSYWANHPNPQYPAPTTFFIYDPPTKTFTQITAPNGSTNDDIPTYKGAMLPLPDGSVLYAHQGSDLYVYQLTHAVVNPGSRPVIQALNPNGDGTWRLTGTQLNGLSQGATYGDDLQMDSNYPLVQLLTASGQITYARTFNWSSTGVRTGNKVVSTDFVVPSNIAGTGAVSVVVVANGIASAPMPMPVVQPGQTLTFSGNSSMGSSGYEIMGGTTLFVDDGSASGYLLRGAGGTIQLLDSATAGNAGIYVDGGPGNGGVPGYLRFSNNATAGNANIIDHPGVRGPNFKNATPNPQDGFAGETFFYDNSTAGTAHFSNEGEADNGCSNGASGGLTTFSDNASADHGTFVNHASAISNGKGGIVQFIGSSTAGQATFTNLNSPNSSPYGQGRTVFWANANGGQGIFVNIGGDGGFLELGGSTEFRLTSTAASGTFINQGPTGGNFPQRGNTQFFDTATAGHGTFRNTPGYGGGGGTEFYNQSTAGNGTFINDSTAGASGMGGGEVLFRDDSRAGTGYFHTMGVAGGYVTFHERSSADHGTFLIDPNLNNARIVFRDSSTASNATFEVGGNGYIQFFDSATAGNANILLRGTGAGGYGGIGSTLGNANVTVNGAEVGGAVGANIGFASPATAGNATITVNGASVTTFGATGGSASFDYSSSAGTATFIVNGGSNGGPGGVVTFGRGATADQAHVIVNAGGKLDVAGNAYYNGTSVGTVEGAGSVYLGFGALTIGGLNTDATISGVISDYNVPGYVGTVTKIGVGALTLSGSNTYSGLTTISGGTLAVDGYVKGDVQVNAGATLKGSGTIGGSVTAAPGATVAPGHSPGVLTINGNYTQAPQSALQIIVAGPNPINRSLLVVKGNVTLNGTLLLVFSGYAPSASETFPILQATGTLTSNTLNIITAGLQPGFQATYQVSAGQLIFGALNTGRLRTGSDPVQVLTPTYTSAGFLLPVFELTGATYQFDTSTDLINWTRVLSMTGANNLFEFRPIPTPIDMKRFYRVLQAAGP